MKTITTLAICAMPAFAQHTVHREGPVIRLEDAKARTTVSIVPSRGNMA
jgi:hypothetical protein